MKAKIANTLGLLLLLTVLGVGCSVSIDLTPPPPAGYVRVVGADSVNVRVCPSPGCDVRTVVYRGQAVRVYEYQNGWARIVVSDSGVPGWMDARYLRMP
ncbi:SH3 type 3 domain protein [Solidesulfovibrio fructosivorans JJ]]|uniref:SH3 type 3 domain protein n=1 Tax=Solidesulfovibrio fructosivorans JJ] TaxID=596151 RepID=E1JRY0_SOLFR|nr:SH3 domain-containing protein [Solidesulfovibrio fructosivorans]EFL52749.1 SH3 type 3 domain protein [Solidesulfovibrio fructosivorans JJ]]